MKQKERFLGRLGKLGSEVFVSGASLRQEIESLGVERVERLAKRLHLVRRAEFEAVAAMVKEARCAQEDLAARLTKIESRLGIKKVLTGKKPVGPRGKKAKS